MSKGLAKRIAITLGILATPFILGLLLTYQIIHVDWVSFMEIQPFFRPMEDPLPVPSQSVPIEGAAFIPGAGSPENPIPSDQDSLARGQSLYEINCVLCHGKQGDGITQVAEKLNRKPADLNGENVTSLSDGEIYFVITDGVHPPSGILGGMPGLKENLNVNDRWDIVNYVRNLQGN